MEYELTNPEPLYVSDIGIPKAGDIPPCPDCGQERTFEFQVLFLPFSFVSHFFHLSIPFRISKILFFFLHESLTTTRSCPKC